MRDGVIDVWNVETFDGELMGELQSYEQLAKDYMETDTRILYDYISSERRGLRPDNPYHGRYLWLVEHITDYMKSRTIRAWHYTRLTDDEAEGILCGGVHLSTYKTTRNRLEARVAAGDFSAEVAERLLAASPLQNPNQLEARVNRFWMTSDPIEVDDSLVTLLLQNWGGEVVYFWLQDTELERTVASIGKARVIELAVPMTFTDRSGLAAEAVLAAYGRSIGCLPQRGAFDLYSNHPLGPEAVLHLHTEDEASFAHVGRRQAA